LAGSCVQSHPRPSHQGCGVKRIYYVVVAPVFTEEWLPVGYCLSENQIL